jgi:DNA polymerase III subunit chi
MKKAQINFYHLTYTLVEKALPKLLEKATISNNLRVVIINPEISKIEEYDKLLWTYSSITFMPHSTMNDDFSEEQPIYITDKLENPNMANIIITTGNYYLDQIEDSFDKYLILFDGTNAEQLEKARKQWLFYKNESYQLNYFQQDEQGKWVEKKKEEAR